MIKLSDKKPRRAPCGRREAGKHPGARGRREHPGGRGMFSPFLTGQCAAAAKDSMSTQREKESAAHCPPATSTGPHGATATKQPGEGTGSDGDRVYTDAGQAAPKRCDRSVITPLPPASCLLGHMAPGWGSQVDF